MCPIRFNNGEYGISTSQDPLLSSTSNFSFTPVNRSVASDETGSTFDSAQFDFETLPTSSGFTSPQIDSPNPSYNQYATSILDLTKLTSPATESFHPSNARSNSPIPTTPNPHTADYESISRGALFSPRHISRFISYGTDTTPQTPESFQSSVDSRQGRTAIDHPGLIPKIHHSGSSSFNSIKGQDQTLTENLVAKGGVFPVLVTGPPIASLENSNYLNSLSTSKEQEQDSRLANLGRTYLRTSQSPPCNTFYTRSQLHQLAFQPAPLHPTMNTLSTPMQAYQTPQQSSPPPLPATSFPTPLPPPANLPVRVPPLLDEAFASQNLILDPSTDENRNTKAWDALMQHKKDRFPHVMNASDRLQAAMGLKNEHPFDLPQTPASVLANRAALPPALRALYDVPDVGLGINLNSEPVRGVKRNLNATEPKTSMGLGDTVDKETGRGLREFLLLRGKEVGMRKVACKSLTFHDFTPDLRTNAHRNVILGHYAAEAGCRADFYEVELPATHTDPDTGLVIQTSESWIWFLLSRPMFSHKPTYPTDTPASGSTQFYTPSSSTSILHPNLPHPIPTSWLVFALPKAHATTYATRTEDLSSNNSLKKPTSSLITKRTEFDLSHSGFPVFEFSPKSEEFELSTWAPYMAAKVNEAPASEAVRLEGVYAGGDRGCWLSFEGAEEDFNKGLVREVERWVGIKGAMGRGKLRVVVRWNEFVGGGEDGNVVMGGMGMEDGLQRRTTRSEARKRSVLGAEMVRATGGVLMGVGMPSRTRASLRGAGLRMVEMEGENEGGVRLKSPEKKLQALKKKGKGRKR